MRMPVARFPGLLSKVLELAGAGLASAIGAFLLSQMISKPAPPAPEPRMVQLAPADAELIGIVRADQAALLAELQKVLPEAAPAPKPAPAPKAPAAAPPKPVKAAQPVPLPREPKGDAARPVTASYKAAADEPLPIQPASMAATAPLRPVAAVAEAEPRPAAAEGSNSRRVFSTLKDLPSWFVPDTDKLFSDAPRPPLPVGQFVSRAM